VVNESCPENDCQRDVRFKVTSEVTNSISSLAIEPAVTQYFGALNQVLLTTTGGMNDEPIRQQTHYDAQGRVISTTQPYFAGQEKHFTETFYDVLGRQIKVQLPYYTNADIRAEQTYSYGVSATGRLERQVTDAKSRITTAEVNALGQVTQVTDAENGVMQYHYDSQGNLIETVDAMGNSITLAYDLLGRRTQLNDPDLGISSYTYNGFSELTSQTDAKNQTISMEYDLLGRLTQRSVPGAVELGGGVSTWEYDTALRGAGDTWFGAISRVEGLKSSATGTPGYVRSFEYDALGRASSEATTIHDQIFNERYEYNPATGRLATRYYPNSTTRTAANLNDDYSATEFGVKYEYTNGYLSSILSTENAQGQCIEHWRANHYDALGRVDLETVGKLVTTKRNFKPGQNVLEQIRSVRAGANPLVQDLQYSYDSVNNLTARTDAVNNITETFDYDNLDRLINHIRTKETESPVTTTVEYDAIGNITFKSDVGHYSYNPSGPGSVRPHAVKGITGSVGDQNLNVANTDLAKFNINWEYNGQNAVRSLPSVRNALLEVSGQADPIQYDVNGNATQSGTRSIAWTPFDKPQRMAASLDTNGTSKVSVYQYGPEQQRIIKREATVDALSVPLSAPNTTVYIGKYYERIQDENNNVTHRYMIETGGTTIQIERAEGGSTDTPKYLLADNLGSTHVILNAKAEIEQTLAFDPWGMRLNVGDSSQVNSVTNRGYTGHEMDDEVGLINMNARVYDPYLGRFMSADPVLPDAFDMPFNRYAYVTNNPLKYTDPTGNEPATAAALAQQAILVSAISFAFDYIGSFFSGGERTGQRNLGDAIRTRFGNAILTGNFSIEDSNFRESNVRSDEGAGGTGLDVAIGEVLRSLVDAVGGTSNSEGEDKPDIRLGAFRQILTKPKTGPVVIGGGSLEGPSECGGASGRPCVRSIGEELDALSRGLRDSSLPGIFLNFCLNYPQVCSNIILSTGKDKGKVVNEGLESEGDGTQTAGEIEEVLSEDDGSIVLGEGVRVRNTPQEVRDDLEEAGFPGEPTTETMEEGTIHRDIPGRDGKIDVRVMNGGNVHGPRIVVTRGGSRNDPVRPDGSRFRNNESGRERRSQSHIPLR